MIAPASLFHLGFVHILVGCFEQRFALDAVFGIQAEAATGFDAQFVAIEKDGLGNGTHQEPCNAARFASVDVSGQHYDEFIPADSGREIRTSDILENMACNV